MKQFSKLMSTIRVPVSGVLISLALFFVLTVPGANSASAQTTQTRQMAYVQYVYIQPNIEAALRSSRTGRHLRGANSHSGRFDKDSKRGSDPSLP